MTNVAEKERVETLPAPKKRRFRGSLMPAGQYRRFLWMRLEAGVTADDLRDRDFWGVVAPKLQRHDVVTCLSYNEDQEIEVCVEEVFRDGAKVSVRKVFARDGFDGNATFIDDAGEFFVQYRGSEQWCVVRRTDDRPIIRGHATKADAVAEYRRQQPRPVL